MEKMGIRMRNWKTALNEFVSKNIHEKTTH
jgi:hypothetical protein